MVVSWLKVLYHWKRWTPSGSLSKSKYSNDEVSIHHISSLPRIIVSQTNSGLLPSISHAHVNIIT